MKGSNSFTWRKPNDVVVMAHWPSSDSPVPVCVSKDQQAEDSWLSLGLWINSVTMLTQYTQTSIHLTTSSIFLSFFLYWIIVPPIWTWSFPWVLQLPRPHTSLLQLNCAPAAWLCSNIRSRRMSRQRHLLQNSTQGSLSYSHRELASLLLRPCSSLLCWGLFNILWQLYNSWMHVLTHTHTHTSAMRINISNQYQRVTYVCL